MQNTIRLVESNDGIATLEIERPLNEQGAEPLWKTLFHLRVQVVSADVRVVGTNLRERVRVCEFDGAPLSVKREHEVAGAVGGQVVTPRPQNLRRTTGHRLSL